MNPEKKVCQNCRKNFTVQSEDLDFYEKLKVPPPTFCPDCRLQRRILWRCERSLYKRTCDLCGKSIISVYSKDKPYKVYCRECFHGDAWDPLSFGRDYDFARSFFEQFKELQHDVPRQFAFAFQNVNSDYTNGSAFNKNCYLIFVSDHNEDSQYSYSIYNCRNSADLLNSNECELCYECITCVKCYLVLFSKDCSSSQNLYFCRNLANCHDCVGSANLRNRQYCIFNEQYSKEDYQKKLEELKLSTRAGLEDIGRLAHEFWKKFPQKYIHGFQNQDVAGDYIFNSKNCDRCFDAETLEDCKFLNQANKSKFVYDAYVCVDGSEYSLEFVGGLGARNAKFCLWPFTDFDVDYADSCENSNDLFGCVSLHKKQYCILNKQYSKEEYGTLRARIIEQMKTMPYVDTKGRTYSYGEFFPSDICEFGYNESVVQEYYPLTREEALRQGYKWKDPEDKGYVPTLKPENIPDSIEGVEDAVTREIIGCQHRGACNHGCTEAFRVTSAELQFYKRLNIPLAVLCFNCRHFARLENKNPTRLVHRACMCMGVISDMRHTTGGMENAPYKNTVRHFHGDSVCPNEFETTYPPDKPDIIYCEACYQSEVA
jgi:hypothetical protein